MRLRHGATHDVLACWYRCRPLHHHACNR
ncbi:hypothetical protein [Streptomyces anulatus]